MFLVSMPTVRGFSHPREEAARGKRQGRDLLWYVASHSLKRIYSIEPPPPQMAPAKGGWGRAMEKAAFQSPGKVCAFDLPCPQAQGFPVSPLLISALWPRPPQVLLKPTPSRGCFPFPPYRAHGGQRLRQEGCCARKVN